VGKKYEICQFVVMSLLPRPLAHYTHTHTQIRAKKVGGRYRMADQRHCQYLSLFTAHSQAAFGSFLMAFPFPSHLTPHQPLVKCFSSGD